MGSLVRASTDHHNPSQKGRIFLILMQKSRYRGLGAEGVLADLHSFLLLFLIPADKEHDPCSGALCPTVSMIAVGLPDVRNTNVQGTMAFAIVPYSKLPFPVLIYHTDWSAIIDLD